jgi:hypothetical protein
VLDRQTDDIFESITIIEDYTPSCRGWCSPCGTAWWRSTRRTGSREHASHEVGA